MGKIKRIVKMHGLGIPREVAGLDGSEAYDDLTLFLGASQHFVSEDGVKITGMVLDCLEKMPEIQSDSVDPFVPATSFGSAEFSVQIDKEYNARDYVAGYRHEFLGEQLSRFLNVGSVTPWGIYLLDTGSQMDVASWSEHVETDWIYVARRPWKGHLSAGDSIWWGREALLITAYEPYAKGYVGSLPDSNCRFKAIKRAFGTYHERRADANGAEEDLEIFVENPIKLGRDITIYDYHEDTGDIVHKWSGYMERPRSSSNQSAVNIICQGKIGIFNRMRPLQYAALWNPAANDMSVAGYSPHKRYSELKQIPGKTNMMVVGQGSAIILAKYKRTAIEPDGRKIYSVDPILGAIMGTGFTRKKENEAKDLGPLREILVGEPDWCHFIIDGAYSTHPFDVIRCLMHTDRGSEDNIFDVLPRGCGLSIPYDRTNHAEIDALKSGSLGGSSWLYANLQMRSLVIGQDKSEDDIWTTINRILAPLMCILSQDSEGLFTIRTMIDLGPDRVVASYVEDDFLRGGLMYESTAYDPVRDIKFTIARRGLSDEYSGEIRASDLRKGIERRYAGLAQDEDVSAIDYGDPAIVPTNWMAVPETRSLMALCSIRYDMRNSGIHYYRMRKMPDNDNLVPGDLVTVTHRIPFNNDGDRGLTDRRMMVLERDEQSPKEGGAIRIRLMDVESLNQAGKLIAPAWERLSATTTTWRVKTSTTPWVDLIRVGMVVTVLTSSFAQRWPGVTRTITAYDSGTQTITFSSAWPGYSGSTDKLILADWLDSAASEKQEYSWVSDDDGALLYDEEGMTWGF